MRDGYTTREAPFYHGLVALALLTHRAWNVAIHLAAIAATALAAELCVYYSVSRGVLKIRWSVQALE